ILNWFGWFAGDYNILKLGPDYEYALVGDKARSTFWILSRTKEMPDALYQELLDIAEDRGFKKELIRKSPVFTR
ncbi:MAG: lipocalin family protein, partial [Halobacteriovoraceae bacterium]|nr:lipocalin family protein [Halobacteriovoraceae bacterium]